MQLSQNLKTLQAQYAVAMKELEDEKTKNDESKKEKSVLLISLETLIADNNASKIIISENETEITLFKQKIDELQHKLNRIQLISPYVIIDMLMKGNEARDAIIRKLMRKSRSSSSSSSDVSSDASNLSLETLAPTPPLRRYGYRAVNALSELGAENIMGPWLCLVCGRNNTPIEFSTYPKYRSHLVEVHQEQIDEALCEHCGWRSEDLQELYVHILKEH
ncbi:maker178 [Drosophila busckii]|uniref:Maker178 n=2 Tax=Drosophila busckii TaxID=30019 RepID=A0A0M4EHJ6_DROBS|nr:maker178 [Drosophila busckii]